MSSLLRTFCGAALCCAMLALPAAASGPSYTVQPFAGSDFVGDGGPAIRAALSQAEGIAADGYGNIYVADANDHRIRRISADGRIATYAGTGRAGFTDNRPAVTAQLQNPYGLALDRAGNLYVADLGNGRVRRISPDGLITTVAGGPQSPLIEPRNVAVDASGNLYICDFAAHKVYRAERNGALTIVAGTGVAGFSGDGGFAVTAQLSSPAGIAVDATGALYIADSVNLRVRVVRAGIIQTFSDSPSLTVPKGLSIAPDGALFIANGAGPAVRLATSGTATVLRERASDVFAIGGGSVYVTSRNVVKLLASSGAAISIAGGAAYTFAGDGGSALEARLGGPYALARSARGDVYVADMLNRRVRRIDPSGSIATVAGNGDSARLNEPAGLAVTPDGKLYISDRASHRVFALEGDTLRTVAGTGEAGFTPDGKLPASTSLNSPHGLTADAAGNLYIADTGNHRVLKLTRTGTISTVAGGGDDPLNEPRGVAVEPAGTLLIADTGNGRLRRLGPGGTLTDACERRFNLPRAVAVRSDGSILVADSGGNRIVAVSAFGETRVVAGTGERGYEGDAGIAIDARFDAPMDLLPLPDGSFLVADFGNNRIRRLQPSAPIAGAMRTPIRIVHAASQVSQAVAPGQLITIYDAPLSGPQTQLSVDGKPARVLYAKNGQINAQLPSDIAAPAQLALRIFDETDALDYEVSVTAVAPGLFTTANGRGQAAATNENGSANAAATPAGAGSVVTLYGTGIPPGVPVEVEIGGQSSEVVYVTASSSAPGVRLIVVRIPLGISPSATAPVTVRAGVAESQSGVTIAVH